VSRVNLRLVRCARPGDGLFVARAKKHKDICELAAKIAGDGPGAIDAMAGESSGSLVGWFNAKRHTDDTGIVYIMPIICHGTVVVVGTKRMRVYPGDVFAFDDYVNHRTIDTAPCVGIIYACGKRDESDALPAIDRQLRRLAK
jgi:hypothetical protein